MAGDAQHLQHLAVLVLRVQQVGATRGAVRRGIVQRGHDLIELLAAEAAPTQAADERQQGHGTPAPVEPPKELVAVGFYRYVRNPMYVGILWMLAGHFLWFGFWNLLIYGVVVFLAFYSFVTFYEEPTLKKKFGRAYEEYLQRVPGWIPRLPK